MVVWVCLMFFHKFEKAFCRNYRVKESPAPKKSVCFVWEESDESDVGGVEDLEKQALELANAWTELFIGVGLDFCDFANHIIRLIINNN